MEVWERGGEKRRRGEKGEGEGRRREGGEESGEERKERGELKDWTEGESNTEV